ncbi:MAG: glycosyltransferase N-terminal domain-containing protein [Edaphocola sp.]
MLFPLFLYDAAMALYRAGIWLAVPRNRKARSFYNGRKMLLQRIGLAMECDTRARIWVHCASLGEFEQGRPVIEALKQQFPQYSVVLTFFSPSGYEASKDYAHADHIFYLPIDTAANAHDFVAAVKPVCALFVKYEFWYHCLKELHARKIPAILFSAVFQQRHPFFKWYGSLYRQMLQWYAQIFVQDEHSLKLLAALNPRLPVQLGGDTRFDRAAKVLASNKSFDNVALFKGNKQLLVAGSTWQDDEMLLQSAFEHLTADYKMLVAPHNVNQDNIDRLLALWPHSACLWNADAATLQSCNIAIVHSMGQLASLYKYADVVWVGGGFTRSGIHNAIEPAVFGKPIFFGPEYSRYVEAQALVQHRAAAPCKDAEEFLTALKNETALRKMGSNAAGYVQSQIGGTAKIIAYLSANTF